MENEKNVVWSTAPNGKRRLSIDGYAFEMRRINGLTRFTYKCANRRDTGCKAAVDFEGRDMVTEDVSTFRIRNGKEYYKTVAFQEIVHTCDMSSSRARLSQQTTNTIQVTAERHMCHNSS